MIITSCYRRLLSVAVLAVALGDVKCENLKVLKVSVSALKFKSQTHVWVRVPCGPRLCPLREAWKLWKRPDEGSVDACRH